MTRTKDEILQNVQHYYAERARSSTSCCGDSSDCQPTFYDSTLIADLPENVTGFSLGCGDAITLAQLQPGETVLDLGSGGGLDCFLAARQVGDAGRVIGVDMTPDMLERARSTASRLGFKNVEFRQGYIEALPVDSNSVDVVISNCVINLSPDKSLVFAEIFRVLKPGGRLAVSDVVARSELPDAIRNDMLIWSQCGAGALPKYQYEHDLIEAGFVDILIQDKADNAEVIENASQGLLFSGLISARKP